MKSAPPKLAQLILEKLQYDDVWKTTLGDFEEYYFHLLKKEGKRAARRWYWKQVVRYAPSKTIHKLYWSAAMLLNYLKISFRNLTKHKSYSFINIAGLTSGISCFLLIFLFLQYELSYDNFHENSDRTYRVIARQPGNEYMGSDMYSLTPTAMGATMKLDFPEVEAATYFGQTTTLLTYEDLNFRERGVLADGDFFRIFTYRWISGNPETALADPYAIILTQSMAKKLFGHENPIGKSIDQTYGTGKKVTKTVTGVVSDPPGNSHFSFHYVMNDQTTPYYKYNLEEWGNTNYYTFITLKKGISAEAFSEKLPDFAKTYIGASDFYKDQPENLPVHSLQALEEIHLNSSHLNFNPSSGGNIKYVYMFATIAVIIVLIACINYMNLSTARSLTRATEIGVRKSVGAMRSNLAMQFVSEAIVISLLSLAASVVIVAAALPFFSELTNRELSLQIFLQPSWLGALLGISILTGVISGSYPAFFMSKFKPVLILKNQFSGNKSTPFVRNLLVTAQFTVTVILLIASIVVYRQLNYIQHTDTGLNRERVVLVSTTDQELWDRFETLKTELLSVPAVQQVSSSQYEPIYMSSRTSGVKWEDQKEGETVNMYVSPVGFDFVEMFDIDITAGRSFSKDKFKETETDFLVNQAALSEFGWSPEDAIGKSLSVWGNSGRIVGVVKDFNFLSLHQQIEPLSLMLAPQYNHRYVLAKIDDHDIQETLSTIESKVKEFSPGYPFSYSFLDDSFANMYRMELRLGTIFNYFTLLALLIACLGLFGLATFVIEQRTKEIGIRKVLGGSTLQIIALLNKDFLKLVTLSFIIAAPAGWLLANEWLKDFAYRVDVGILSVAASAAFIFAVAFITISFKSVQTASANPVDSLRNE